MQHEPPTDQEIDQVINFLADPEGIPEPSEETRSRVIGLLSRQVE